MTKTGKLEAENAKLKEIIEFYKAELALCYKNGNRYMNSNHIHKLNVLESELSAIQSVIPQEEEDKRKTLITDYHKKIRELILEESKKGNVVFASFDGLSLMKLEDIINQPIDGLLYDLNRDVATVLTCIDDPKWVNDYAVCSVITALHKKAFPDL